MKNRLISTIIFSFCFVASYAQSQCDALLKDAQKYKNEGEYEKAVEYYNKLEQKCPPYFTETVKKERRSCEEKLKSQNKPKPQNTSSGYIPAQRFSSDSAHNTRLYFDAEGASRHSSRVTLDMTVTDVDNKTEWFSVEIEYGNTVVVHCEANPYSSERKGDFLILLNNGTSFQTIIVEQEGKRSSPKSKTRTNTTVQSVEEQPIIMNISFEKGKETPKYDNIGKIIGSMEDNKNFTLQLEIPWCMNIYKEKLVKKRIKNITDDLFRLGIAKERVTANMPVLGTENADPACDCASAKIVK